jgi:hypothetical protein
MAARSSSGSKAVRFEQERDDEGSSDELPQPPNVPRRMRWRAPQVAGLVLISILPALAIARLLDPSPRVAHASAGQVELAVSTPQRLRYRMTDWVFVDVRNPSDRPLESVTVEVDAAFVEGFAQASFIPEAARVDEQRYSVDLGRLRPGESRRVSLQLQAEKYGKRAGSVAVVAGTSRAAIPVDVFVFP